MPEPALRPPTNEPTGFLNERQFVIISTSLDNSDRDHPNLGVKFERPDTTAFFWQTFFPAGRTPIRTISTAIPDLYESASKPRYIFKDPNSVTEAFEAIDALTNCQVDVYIRNTRGNDGRMHPEITKIFKPDASPAGSASLAASASAASSAAVPFDDDLPFDLQQQPQPEEPNLSSIMHRCIIINRYSNELGTYARRILTGYSSRNNKTDFNKTVAALEEAIKRLKKELQIDE